MKFGTIALKFGTIHVIQQLAYSGTVKAPPAPLNNPPEEVPTVTVTISFVGCTSCTEEGHVNASMAIVKNAQSFCVRTTGEPIAKPG